MASPPSIGSEYDPKNDLARKQRKSTDPGWKYAYWPDLGNKDEVACTLCGGSVRGGIKRLKQHLAGGFGDAKICPKVGTDLRREMAAYLEANKRRRPLFLEAEDVEAEVVEVSANGASVSVNGAAPISEPQQSESSQATKKRIEGIGKDKVVQVVIDNGANFKAAGKLLMERIPTIFWSPCAAHCLDLMLEDIGNLEAFKQPIARARHVTTFIYRHGRILHAMREKTGGADLVRPVATRFATAFLTLKSLHKQKDALKGLFVSEKWTGNKLAKTKAGLDVHDIVLSTEFWNKVEDCLRASAPLLIVLRVVDGDEKPAMPEVQALMNHAKEKIKLSFAIQSKRRLLEKIMKIIEQRWEKQMDHPLYGAALYLNPGKLHPLIRKDDDVIVG
ncbi:hypothetical protein E2562_010593 [Oryza meyeriana var. granulata]|uniref:DUF659 domain-containing protein n=1 Tax=Oryza meyeriana var. granulata TaxID=110450 RepID=A0A6G1BVE8_9ORYZ|nr:hypothetical protein E2562_010593 [Oryza meyeriana var. granulata]